MSNPYDARRIQFEKILNSYRSYLALYQLCNNGSKAGCTPFDEFYWRTTYHQTYAKSR